MRDGPLRSGRRPHHEGRVPASSVQDQLMTAEIKGTLTVTDPHAFTGTIATGVGRARSYSAGLLLVRPTADA
ncbi:type I-E CRISPR-associated protein Cas6/Cse3/CasE [Streptomyces sp. CBMA123]|uniref:type I-E CRISPR-associated protein Cas6/Cse3/CasE n=1 Tax=Streptomyces sp. CBMA123 TaxID=1896313 RepID=UPI00294FF58B|nr:type I-E CRISPR-associated protein Cas6/Cse3/CasE [Streptomyces sp. CBMA123]